MSCNPIVQRTWALVPGSTPEEQWPHFAVPLRGFQTVYDDSRASVKSPVGTRYQFKQTIGLYAAVEMLTFKVRVRDSDRSAPRLMDFLRDRGTIKPIKMAVPFTVVNKWTQKTPAQIVNTGDGVYEVSLSFEQDYTPG